jgi:hypothetical protein
MEMASMKTVASTPLFTLTNLTETLVLSATKKLPPFSQEAPIPFVPLSDPAIFMFNSASG